MVKRLEEIDSGDFGSPGRGCPWCPDGLREGLEDFALTMSRWAETRMVSTASFWY